MLRLTTIVALFALYGPLACKKKDDGGGGDDSSPAKTPPPVAVDAPPVSQPTSTTSAPPVTAPTSQTTTTTTGFSLTRVTPEQLSNNLLRAVGFSDFRFTDNYLNTPGDYLIDIFGVGLGGIDFITASLRDPVTKAQSILIARVIAWQVAKITVINDANNPGNERVFTTCDVTSDLPASQAWQDQAKDLFWRLYARPPSAAELSAVETAFNAALAQESQSTTNAWMAVLYAMLAAEEFWHI